jgi:hypothetical protein
MVAYWRDLGFEDFIGFPMMNRGGALSFEGFDYGDGRLLERARELLPADQFTACRAPFDGQVIGYDGNYYLCCSDWKKEVSVGNVADHSIASVTMAKLRAVNDRHAVCSICNLDPTNRLVDALKAQDDGADAIDIPELVAAVVEEARRSTAIAETIDQAQGDRAHRRLIPVRST